MSKFKIYMVITVTVAAFIAAGCSSLPESQRISGEARVNLRSANIYWNQQDFDRALELYQEVVDEYPENIEALKRISDIYFFFGENRAAQSAEYYRQSIEYNKRILEAYENLSQTTRSIDDIVKDAELKIRGAWARIFQRGQEKYTEGLFDQSLELYYDLAEVTPDSTQVFAMIASIHQQQENQEQSVFYFKKIADIDESDTISRRNLAAYYFAEADYDNALIWFSELDRLNPDNPEILYNIAITHNLKENYRESVDYFLQTYNIDNEFDDAAFNAASLAINFLEDYNKAQEIYMLILENDENNVEAIQSLCYALNLNSEYELLLQYSEKWYQVDKESVEAVQFILIAANRLNKPDLVQKYLGILNTLQ